MRQFHTDPNAVLLVGGAAGVDSIRTAVAAGSGVDVVCVGDTATALSTLEARDDVGCLVALATDAESGIDVPAICEAVRDADDDLPVVVHGRLADDALADVAQWPACRYLPESTPPERVAEAVEDALDAFGRRRRETAESDLFRTLLEDVGIHVFALDGDGRYVYRTPPDGWPHVGDPTGSTPVEFMSDAFRDRAEQAHADNVSVLETGEAVRGKEEHYESDDVEFWMETTKVPWRGEDGEIDGIVGVAVEITDRKECERRVENQRRRLDRFSKYVAHELRTPLQIAFGALERARDGDAEALAEIEDAHRRMAEMVDDLGALSTAEYRSSTGGETATDGIPSARLRPVAEDVWDVVAGDGATLDLDLPPETTVVADPSVVRLVVENLLKNAVDHTGPAVTVRVGLADGEGFYVEDDGPGIPAAERDEVTATGYSTLPDGSGIGLRIVSESVREQSWRLDIGTSDDGGARFEILDCPVVVPRTGIDTDSPVALEAGTDVGAVGTPGDDDYDPETDRWTVAGSGQNLWGNTNEFHFAHGSADGPVRVQGRLVGFDPSTSHSKAGLMIRETLAEDSTFQFLGRTGNCETERVYRSEVGDRARAKQIQDSVTEAPWYRLDSVGDEMTAYVSTDGEDWQAIDQRTIRIDGTRLVGLAVCSLDRDALSEATFANVTAVELDPQ